MNFNNKDWIWKRINHELTYKNDYIFNKGNNEHNSILYNLTSQVTVFNSENYVGSYLGKIHIKNFCNTIFDEVIVYVNDDYPFRAPLLILNNKEYVKYYKKLYDISIDFIRENNIPVICPCCDSITCSWSPSYKIWDIILEMLKFEDSISKIYNFHLIFKLDIDLLIINKIKEYLF